MNWVLNGVIGGVLLCSVGHATGVIEEAKAKPVYEGALPRVDVIATANGCDVIKHLDSDGKATTHINCPDYRDFPH